jgi:hypothetical protein
MRQCAAADRSPFAATCTHVWTRARKSDAFWNLFDRRLLKAGSGRFCHHNPLRGTVSFTSIDNFSEINRNKADFHAIYRRPDPRAYFHTLGSLDYVIPHLAQPIIAQLVAACRRVHARPVTVLDLGCSYGINGALLSTAFLSTCCVHDMPRARCRN